MRQEQWSTFLITGDNLKINYCLYKLIERVYNQQDIKHQFIPAFTCHLSMQSRHGAAHTFFHMWTAVERTKKVTKMMRTNCLSSVLIRICNVALRNAISLSLSPFFSLKLYWLILNFRINAIVKIKTKLRSMTGNKQKQHAKNPLTALLYLDQRICKAAFQTKHHPIYPKWNRVLLK